MSSEVFEELRRLIDSDDAHFVGGCVRDGWLGRPIADVDVVVAGDPAPAARRLARQTGGSPVSPSGARGAWRGVLPGRTAATTAPRGGHLGGDLRRGDCTGKAAAVPLRGTPLLPSRSD